MVLGVSIFLSAAERRWRDGWSFDVVWDSALS
jgi:hypothetical protein